MRERGVVWVPVANRRCWSFTKLRARRKWNENWKNVSMEKGRACWFLSYCIITQEGQRISPPTLAIPENPISSTQDFSNQITLNLFFFLLLPVAMWHKLSSAFEWHSDGGNGGRAGMFETRWKCFNEFLFITQFCCNQHWKNFPVAPSSHWRACKWR